MSGGTVEEKGAESRPANSGPDVVWLIVVWGRVAVGLALAAVGGIAFGHAWTEERAPLWWVGAISLLTGLLLALSGAYARSRPPGPAPEMGIPKDASDEHEPVVPLLGALLVYKYQYVTQQQLNAALARQRKEWREKRRIGEILVDMKALTSFQLQTALEHQRSILLQKQAAQAQHTR